jgi:chromosome partitioning protein
VLNARPTLSHLAARQEIRQLVAALRLPVDEAGRKRSEARRAYAETVNRPFALPDIFAN